MIASCGPELMLRCMIDMTNEFDVSIYVSLERYIKCGVGICGACSVDPLGKMVCADGPIFDAKELLNSEIGKYRREKSGNKRSL